MNTLQLPARRVPPMFSVPYQLRDCHTNNTVRTWYDRGFSCFSYRFSVGEWRVGREAGDGWAKCVIWCTETRVQRLPVVQKRQPVHRKKR